MGKIVEHYEMNNINIKIVQSKTAYDVIFQDGNMTGVFMRGVTLCDAYAFVAGYMYKTVKMMSCELGIN